MSTQAGLEVETVPENIVEGNRISIRGLREWQTAHLRWLLITGVVFLQSLIALAVTLAWLESHPVLLMVLGFFVGWSLGGLFASLHGCSADKTMKVICRRAALFDANWLHMSRVEKSAFSKQVMESTQ